MNRAQSASAHSDDDAPRALTAAATADIRAIVDLAPALISFFDRDHVCRYANAHHTDWYGRSPDTLVGRHMREFLGEAAYAMRKPYLDQVMAGVPQAFDAQVPHADGGLRDAAIRYVPRTGPDGVDGFYIMVFDVAQRKRELAEMLDLAHDAVIVRSLEGRVTFWNRGSQTLYGPAKEEAEGRSLDEVVATRYPRPVAEIEAELLETGHWEGEVERPRADGSEGIVSVRWSLRRDDHGRPVEVLESGRDVTGARRAEQDLRRSEYRFRNVFDALAVSFWELDFRGVAVELARMRDAGVKDYRRHFQEHPELIRKLMEKTIVVDVNEKTCRLFGATREQILGPVAPFWPRTSEGVFAESIFASIERRASIEAETRFLTLGGEEIDCLFTCCFPREGVQRGLILVGILDISDRLKAQDALNRAQSDLAHAARVATLGEMSASIAHEVNQPLAAVVTNGEAGLRWLRHAEPNLKEVEASLRRAIGEAERASEIVTRIRALARPGEGAFGAVDLHALVDDTAVLLRREVQTNDVRFTLKVPAALPLVQADPVQLQQVLTNLGLNAIQAMGASKAPRRDLTISATALAEGVLVEVSDTGPGLAADVAESVFDAFVTTKASGLGLGLSISKSIIERHGGRLWAENRQGGGAVFRFTLREASTVADEQASAGAPATAPEADPASTDTQV